VSLLEDGVCLRKHCAEEGLEIIDYEDKRKPLTSSCLSTALQRGSKPLLDSACDRELITAQRAHSIVG
jgi:hypothetical protein